MLAKHLEKKNDESGFTLVELLVVILIIGILAAVAIPAFMNQRQRANDSTLESDVRNAAMTMETYLSVPKNASLVHSLTNGNGGIPSSQIGWTVIDYGSADAEFIGSTSSSNTPHKLEPWAPAEFPELQLSEGVGVGIVAAGSVDREPGSYCVIGNMVNSNYLTSDEVVSWTNSLYYDSKAGGLYAGSELPDDGACQYYKVRIDAEQDENEN